MADSGIVSQSDVKLESPPPPYSPAAGVPPYPTFPSSTAPYPTGQAGNPPPAGFYPPPQSATSPGFYPPPQPGITTAQENRPTQVVTQPTTTTLVVQQVPGNGPCPRCRGGPIIEQFTCCGIILAIIFFPIGLLCCLFMKRRQCASCGAFV